MCDRKVQAERSLETNSEVYTYVRLHMCIYDT